MALTTIGTAAIDALAITTAKIDADAITAAKIATGAVDTAEIAADAVGASELANNAVDTAAIADNAVTGAKIAMTSDAQGDVLFYGGTDYERLAPGTSGYFLKTQGTSADPIWAAVVTDTSGAWTSGTATTGKTLVMGF